MATRRCFSTKIIESDSFYALPPHAQALYVHLNMAADDDGFLNNASGLARYFYTGKVYLKKLVESRFLLQFGEVYVIKHWRISNTLKSDRIKPLNYPAIASQVWVKENRAYTDHPVPGCPTLLQLRGELPEPEEPGIQNGTNRNPNLTKPNLREINQREENPTEGKRASWWDDIVKEYPQERIGDPEAGYRAYSKAVSTEAEAQQMADSLKVWKQSEQWHKEGGQYIPYLSNWIQRGIWRRKPGKQALPTGASGELGEAELEAIRRVLQEDGKKEEGYV